MSKSFCHQENIPGPFRSVFKMKEESLGFVGLATLTESGNPGNKTLL
jgi:hypothetical protein